MKATIYETVTQQIVEAIEAGVGTYRMPWHVVGTDISSPRNAVSHRAYRGLNIVTLWMIAQAKGYQSGDWATYQQWQERGAQVRKGEKCATVFFWKKIERQGEEESEAEESDDERRARFFAKAYSVFNAGQVDGYKAPTIESLSDQEREERAERFFAATGARIEHGGNQACYVPSLDIIRMPAFGQFRTVAGYYSVLAHECTHWSGSSKRLDRNLSGRFGSESYAMEELIAELGAAFVSAHLGMPNEPRRDHAPYIASWLKVLKNDNRAIFTAATRAQAAADFLGCRDETEDKDERRAD